MWASCVLYTYILLTSALAPCILPIIVPCLEFFTHPLMPSAMQLSLQCFVKPHPGEKKKIKWNEDREMLIQFYSTWTPENCAPLSVLLQTLIMLHVSWIAGRQPMVKGKRAINYSRQLDRIRAVQLGNWCSLKISHYCGWKWRCFVELDGFCCLRTVLQVVQGSMIGLCRIDTIYYRANLWHIKLLWPPWEICTVTGVKATNLMLYKY